MSNVYKTSALFFAALLFFLGICTQNYVGLITSPLQNTQSDNSVSYFSTEHPELLFLYRIDERQVNSFKNLPVPSLKNYSNNIPDNSLSTEIKLLSIHSGYLSYSVNVDRGLTNSDIVFPFHYFW
jgi:hypothetical protein